MAITSRTALPKLGAFAHVAQRLGDQEPVVLDGNAGHGPFPGDRQMCLFTCGNAQIGHASSERLVPHSAPCGDNLTAMPDYPQHGDEWDDWARDWALHLQHNERTKGKLTPSTYLRGLHQWLVWLHDHHPEAIRPALVERKHVEGWLGQLADAGKSTGTRRVRFMTLKSFFRWLRDEPGSDLGERLPTDRVVAPVPEAPPKPIVTDEVMAALLRTCASAGFADLRDAAILRTLYSTGVRRDELVRVDVADLDINAGEMMVMGKGSKPRLVAISGSRTTLALSRYIRVRRRHPAANAAALLLTSRPSPSGEWRMSGGAVLEMLHRRCDAAGVERVHPHQLRHTWAHVAKREGMSNEDLERMAGWSPGSVMSRRYGAAVANERARDALRRLNLGDRI